jgi:hypothetical protein
VQARFENPGHIANIALAGAGFFQLVDLISRWKVTIQQPMLFRADANRVEES